MNLLDENIPLEQRDLLRVRGIHCRVIGQDVARLSISDEDIITLLHRLKRPTLFTRDEDFSNPTSAILAMDSSGWMSPRRRRRCLFSVCCAIRGFRPMPGGWELWPARITTGFISGSGIARRFSRCAGCGRWAPRAAENNRVRGWVVFGRSCVPAATAAGCCRKPLRAPAPAGQPAKSLASPAGNDYIGPVQIAR